MRDKQATDSTGIVVIPKEYAVFRMDERGRWHNEFGPITKISIIRYLNRSISRDEDGYHVIHEIDDKQEKVYFPYEDTALFVVDVTIETSEIYLRLNSQKQIKLNPDALLIKGDSLYLSSTEETIKFSERSLVTIAKLLRYEHENTYFCFNGSKTRIKTTAMHSDPG